MYQFCVQEGVTRVKPCYHTHTHRAHNDDDTLKCHDDENFEKEKHFWKKGLAKNKLPASFISNPRTAWVPLNEW